jgi:hypothetical protein
MAIHSGRYGRFRLLILALALSLTVVSARKGWPVASVAAFQLSNPRSGHPNHVAPWTNYHLHHHQAFPLSKSVSIRSTLENASNHEPSSAFFPFKASPRSAAACLLISILSALVLMTAGAGWAAADEGLSALSDPNGMEDVAEIAELPNPLVPVIFGIGLLGGVGWLTTSLGDVMTEEASLGLQSGARAKKEIERSRSSYFKK